MASTINLSTVIKNVSGRTRKFSYLGAHGVTLAPGASYTFLGTLDSQLLLAGTGLYRQRQQALLTDVTNNYVNISSTMAPDYLEAVAALLLS